MLDINNATMLAHEAVRNYQQLLGNYSQPKWCETSDIDKKAEIITAESYIRDGIRPPISISDMNFAVSEQLFYGTLDAIKEYVNV